MDTSNLTRGLVAFGLVVGFLLYRGCQAGPPTVTVKVTVTPNPVVQGAVQPPNQPVVAAQIVAQPVLAPQGTVNNRYYVINQARLYCGLITHDLQYTGESSLQAWWQTVALPLKQWYFNECQRERRPD